MNYNVCSLLLFMHVYKVIRIIPLTCPLAHNLSSKDRRILGDVIAGMDQPIIPLSSSVNIVFGSVTTVSRTITGTARDLSIAPTHAKRRIFHTAEEDSSCC